MKYILGLTMFFGTIWPITGNAMLILQRDGIFNLPYLAWHWIVPISNFVTYFLLIFLIFKVIRLKTTHLKDRNLIVFNIGLATTTIIWFLGIVKVYIASLERLFYNFPIKNLLIIATLVLFLGILQFLLEAKRNTQNV